MLGIISSLYFHILELDVFLLSFVVQATKSSKVKVKLLMEDNEDEEDVLICWETLFDGSQRVLRFWEKNEEYDKIRQVCALIEQIHVAKIFMYLTRLVPEV